MSEAETQVVPYIFMVLFGLIGVNLIINVCLYFVSKINNIKILSWYWGSLLLTYLFQGQFQSDEMSIMLSFCINIFPCLMLHKIMSDSLDKKVPILKYLVFWVAGIIVSAILKASGVQFAIASLPMCIPIMLSLVIPGLDALVVHRKSTSMLHKFTGLMYIVGGLHVLNFALFRTHPGAQIWGWSVALSNYQVLSLSLFAFAFEDYSKKEKERLQDQVTQKTEELTQTLKLKDTLFKVVLHDIANPMQGQIWILEKNRSTGLTPDSMNHLFRLTNMIRDVIAKVRASEAIKSGNLNFDLRPVSLNQCLDDVKLIFEGQLKKKGISLEIKNELPEGTTFIADQNTFTTSVLCNLISNAIKFSTQDSTLCISCFMKNSKVVIEVEDKGIGIPGEMVLGIFDPVKKRSRLGTDGEKGMGYGLPLVKSFMDYFGGSIEVESRSVETHPIDHGTKVTLTLENTLSH